MFLPRFTITNKVLTQIGKIESARETVEFAPLLLEWEEKFRQDALIRTVYFGCHLEGSELTLSSSEKIVKEDPGRDESAEVVAKNLAIVGRERDIQLAMNYRNVARYIDQLARLGRKTGIAFSEKESFQIHSLLLEKIIPSNQLGIYRIGLVADQTEKLPSPPLPVEVPYQMEDFWIWLKNIDDAVVHPVLVAGIAFVEIVRMQPFSQGNEMMARLIPSLVLAAKGYDNKRFFCLEDYLDKNTAVYGEAMRETAIKAELTEWLEFYTTALATEMSKVKENVRRLSIDNLSSTNLVGQVALTERQLALLSALKMKEELTMAEARRVLPMVSDDTILRDLIVLMGKKLIKRKGNTKGARYILRK